MNSTIDHPCASKDCMPAGLMRFYNFLRAIITAMLVALLLALLARGCSLANMAAPTIAAAAASIEPGTMQLSGTADSRALLDVFVNGEMVGERIAVDADGAWTLETASLPEGTYQASAIAYDAEGTERGTSNVAAWTVSAAGEPIVIADPIEWETPTLALPSENIDPNSIILTGTGTPDSTVEILRNGVAIGTAAVDDNGAWRFEASADGYETEFAARGLQPDGTEIGMSRLGLLTIPAAAAALSLGSADVGEFSADSSGMGLAALGLSGTGQPGASIELFADGKSLGNATVGADGAWQFNGDIGLDSGEYELTAVQTLPGGEAGDPASAGLLSVPDLSAATSEMVDEEDEPTRVAVEIEGIADNVLAGEDVVISGSAEPGATVELFVDGELVGTVTADADGVWEYSGSFEAGEFTVEARDVTDGETQSTSSTQPLVVLMPDSEDTDAEETVNAGDENADLTVATVAPVEDAPTIGTVDFGMSGTGKPGIELVVLENGERVGGATVKADGTWSCTCILPPGEHVLIVQDANDSSYTSQEITFVVENLTTVPKVEPNPNAKPFRCTGTPPRGQLVGTIYYVAQCEYIDLIAARLGTTVSDLRTYNPQISDFSLIYPGQALNVPSDAGCFDDNHNG